LSVQLKWSIDRQRARLLSTLQMYSFREVLRTVSTGVLLHQRAQGAYVVLTHVAAPWVGYRLV